MGMTQNVDTNRWLTFSLLIVTAFVLFAYASAYRRLPPIPEPIRDVPPKPEWRQPAWPEGEDWEVFQPAPSTPEAGTTPLGKRFRLAGTFFSVDEALEPSAVRWAVLEDLSRNQQLVVREEDYVDDVRVARIGADHTVLENRGQSETLWLSFRGVAPGTSTAPQAGGEPTRALEENRFGRRVGESRWVMSRQALLDYYNELMENPERLAALYMTMKPHYESNAIAGYVVDIQGEKEFLESVGLRQNDIIRQVNSMRMISQRRAEYFISEFLQNRVSAVVLDIEREGRPQKLIYMIR